MATHYKVNIRLFFWPTLLVLSVLLFFASILFGEKNFTSDGQLAAYNQDFKFWSGAWATGWPVIADPVSMPLYPIRLVMSGLSLPFDAFVASAYVIAILGMYYFLRRFVDSGPASFGAITFAISGWMLVHLGHTSMIHAAAWLPWMMLEVSVIFLGSGAKKYRGVAILAVTVSMSVFAGHPQITVYSLFLVTLYAFFLVIVNKAWSSLYLFAVGLLCGIGISMPSLMPIAELTPFTYRVKMSTEELFSYSLPIAEIPGLIIPLLYGATQHGWFGYQYRIPEYSGETITFFPSIGLIFSIIAIISAKGDKRYIFFWFVIGLLSLLLALGKGLAPTIFITEHVFPLNIFRAPSRHMLEVTFCFSVLSAIGLQALARKSVRTIHIKLTALSMALLFVLAVSAVLASHALLNLQLTQLIWPTLFTLLMIALSLTLIRFHGDFERVVAFKSISIAILLLNTTTIGYQLPWKIYAAPESHNARPAWVSDFNDKLSHDYRALGMNGWQSVVFNPDVSRLHRLRTLGWYGPLLNNTFAQLSGLTTGGWIQRFVLFGNDVTLDLLSVRYVSIADDEKHLVQAYPDRWTFVKRYGNENVYENLNVLPRARLVCQTSRIENDSSFNISVRDGKSTLSVVDHAYINDASIDGLAYHKECIGHVKILEDYGDSLRIIANVDSDRAFLLLSDLWYPGWQVNVNGSQQPLYRVNNTSRGVFLVAGSSVVEFIFRPTGLLISIFVAVLSLVFITILLFGCNGLPIFRRVAKEL